MTDSNSSLDLLYADILLDHHDHPRNFGCVEKADWTEKGFNPLCGDQVTLSMTFSPDGARLLDCKFEGNGCSISMASASLLTDEMIGKSKTEVLQQIEAFRGSMQQGSTALEIEGDLQALAGVKRFPVRIKCALLPWVTLKKGIEGYDASKS